MRILIITECAQAEKRKISSGIATVFGVSTRIIQEGKDTVNKTGYVLVIRSDLVAILAHRGWSGGR